MATSSNAYACRQRPSQKTLTNWFNAKKVICPTEIANDSLISCRRQGKSMGAGLRLISDGHSILTPLDAGPDFLLALATEFGD